MAVNNEVGTISPLAEVAAVVRERAPRRVLHTDAVQGLQWLDLAAAAADFDLVAVSAHKFGGPKGVGALLVRGSTSVEPLLMGGGQERDRRSGTHNVAGIVAMAEAMRVTVGDADRDGGAGAGPAGPAGRRPRSREVPGLRETVPRDRKVAGSAHVCVEGVENESLLFLLDRGGVCASAASACSSGAMDPSHVLAAMGVPRRGGRRRAAAVARLGLAGRGRRPCARGPARRRPAPPARSTRAAGRRRRGPRRMSDA